MILCWLTVKNDFRENFIREEIEPGTSKRLVIASYGLRVAGSFDKIGSVIPTLVQASA